MAASGSLLTTIELCGDIWDHDHVRPLTDTDRSALQTAAQKHPSAIALAYAADEAAEKLTFLGYITFTRELTQDGFAALKALQNAHIHTVLASDESLELTERFLAKAGLAGDDYIVLDSSALNGLSTAEIAAVIHEKTLVLNNVSVPDIVRVTAAARLFGAVTINGERLEQPELLALGDVVVARPHNITSDYASFLAPTTTLATLRDIVRESRVGQHQLLVGRAMSRLLLASALLMVSIGTTAFLLFDRTPSITPAGLFFVVTIVSLPLMIVLSWRANPRQPLHVKPAAIFRGALSTSHQVIVALSIATLSIASGWFFLAYNHITNHYLIPGGQAYDQSVAITLATFGLSLLASSTIMYSLAGRNPRTKPFLTSRIGLFGAVISLMLLFALVQYEPLQSIVGTAGLTLADWLIVLFCAGVASLVVAIAHFDHRSTKKSVIKDLGHKLKRP